jgi:sulfur carrier protein ThiS
MAKPDDNTVNQFLNHLASQKVLDTIMETMDSIPSPVLVAGGAMAIGAVVAALGSVSIPAAVSVAIPLSLKSALSSLKPALLLDFLLLNKGPNISSSYLPHMSPAMFPKYSLMEHTSMTIAELLQAMSHSRSRRLVAEYFNKQTLPRDAHADDRFSGEDVFNINHDSYTAVNLATFHPKCLMHMALLADVIHKAHSLCSFPEAMLLVRMHIFLCRPNHRLLASKCQRKAQI